MYPESDTGWLLKGQKVIMDKNKEFNFDEIQRALEEKVEVQETEAPGESEVSEKNRERRRNGRTRNLRRRRRSGRTRNPREEKRNGRTRSPGKRPRRSERSSGKQRMLTKNGNPRHQKRTEISKGQRTPENPGTAGKGKKEKRF